ncbi:hypothetical protein JG687_00009911 [Phytophthora cactorum]|uniref:Uncharacterized protein n=1 Tax=Phytophthora cactorum TaxID=29920 RepID=A0A8T1UBF2_9STRA|nr:hypothetical protein JG687_00009911 [Phytophthora cactorum]
MKNVETAETDTQAVLDLTRGPEQKETAATTSDEAGVVTTGSALERFFRASEKTLNVLISNFLISQGLPYTLCSSAAFQDVIRAATGNPAFQILGRDRHDHLVSTILRSGGWVHSYRRSSRKRVSSRFSI